MKSHQVSCLLFVGITCTLSWYFFPFGWVLLGIQGIDKGIKKCVTLGSLNTVLGIYKLWYGVLSTSRGRQYSIMDTFHTLHESRVPVEHFRTLEVCRLEYPLASYMRQSSNVSYFA